MKQLYHGTIDKFVPSIFEKGLVPVEDNKWDVTMGVFGFNPKQDEEPGYVFLTTSLGKAMKYATGKALYYRSAPGDKIGIPGLNSRIYKNSTAPTIEDAKPVVIKVLVPEKFELEPDPRDHFDAYRHLGPIEPKRIIKIQEIPYDDTRP